MNVNRPLKIQVEAVMVVLSLHFIGLKEAEGRKMNCFSCCMSDNRIARRSFKKSIRDYKLVKSIGSFANISFKSGKLLSFKVQIAQFESLPISHHDSCSEQQAEVHNKNWTGKSFYPNFHFSRAMFCN